ncbi:putrescine ABC transporter ATPase [Escherichia coli]|nr:putrescine ABC transporter ATPase [Escherichia coli]
MHIAYLGDLSVYHVRLQSGQMISAQLQTAHRYRKWLTTWGHVRRWCLDVVPLARMRGVV